MTADVPNVILPVGHKVGFTMVDNNTNTTKRAHSNKDRLSQGTENYLLSLYILMEEGLRATAGQLADHLKGLPAGEHLGTSLPSVLGMLRRMAREGLIELTTEKEVKLTKVGIVEAEAMVRRHRLAERMVVDLFGLDLHRAHEEAHRLEHAISPDLEAKIAEKLGYPTTCPFGGPIPGSGYTPPSNNIISLDKTQNNETYQIDRVPEENPVLLEFLVKQSILPEQKLSVVDASPHRGVIAIRTSMGEEALGYTVASRIWLHQVS